MVIRLAAERLSLELLPELGGSIGRFEWEDEHEGPRPILRGSHSPGSPLDAGCFPLVPYSNRIREGTFAFRGRNVRLSPNMAGDPSPLHGQGWMESWRVENRSESTAEIVYDHQPGEWPWRYEARQSITLDPLGLSVRLLCRNMDAEPMPCGLGFHPYFPCTETTRLATQVENVWTVDDRVLPVARIPATGRYDLSDWPICARGLDNGYDGWSGDVRIRTPGAPFRLRLSATGARFFQLYSPPDGGLFVAEPVTHANAVLNTPEQDWPSHGMRVLAPGEAMEMAMRLDVLAI